MVSRSVMGGLNDLKENIHLIQEDIWIRRISKQRKYGRTTGKFERNNE